MSEPADLARDALGDFAQDVERLLKLVSANAAQILQDLDAAATRPISALANVNGIAADGARSINDKSAAFLQGAAPMSVEPQPNAFHALADRSRSFAGDVSGISDRQAETISDEVASSMSAAQGFDLVRQKVATLERMAEIGADALTGMRARLAAGAAAEDAPGVDFAALGRLYISESQRRLHAQICGTAPEAAAEEESAPIELF